MKCWRIIAAIPLGSLAAVSLVVPVLAQDGEELPSVLADAFVKIAVLVDGVLGFWSSGDTVTEPLGTQMVASFGQIVEIAVDFVANIFRVATSG